MFKKLIPLSLISALALAHSAIAQETAAPDAGADLDMGQPVSTGPALGERYVKETFGDWKLACVKTDTGADPCTIVQLLLNQEGNPLAEVTMFKIDQGLAVAGATIIVPLETLLPRQLTISVDGASAKRYEYQFCNQVGCFAQIGLSGEDVEAFKKGNEAVVTIVPALAPDQVMSMTMSLSGFTAGYDALELVKPNQQ